MQIVIDIPEEEYEDIINDEFSKLHKLRGAIFNGTPLPEHHGRLLILDEARVEANSIPFHSSCQKWLSEVGLSNSVVKIIPATKEGVE